MNHTHLEFKVRYLVWLHLRKEGWIDLLVFAIIIISFNQSSARLMGVFIWDFNLFKSLGFLHQDHCIYLAKGFHGSILLSRSQEKGKSLFAFSNFPLVSFPLTLVHAKVLLTWIVFFVFFSCKCQNSLCIPLGARRSTKSVTSLSY